MLDVWVPGAEAAGRDGEDLAVAELVAFGQAVRAAFPAVEVVAHAVHAGHGLVASGLAGLDELTGHLGPGPAADLALLTQPCAEFRGHHAFFRGMDIR
jgi:hypothetical protein